MRKEHDEQFDPSKPALIVTYGNTTRKHRPLVGDLVVIGRSSCCDIGLVSPEVAPIHCVILHSADGWRVRDCTGRSGTRVNGKSVNDVLLDDGDTLQIGTFSFQLNLPRSAPTERRAPPVQPPAVGPSQVAGNKADEAKIVHLKQSRERLARHALNLRRRLREQKATPPTSTAPVAPSHLDADLGAPRVELEQREKKLRFWEKELTEQDRHLREEYAEVEHQRKELQRFAAETLARKQVELEQKAAALLADRQKELDQTERRLAQRQTELELLAGSRTGIKHDLEQERQQLEEQMAQVLAERQAELSALEDALREKQRDLDEQLTQVEEIRAALAEEREALRLENAHTAHERDLAQMELDTKVREAEEYVGVLSQQGEMQRRRIEETHSPVVAVPDNSDLRRALDLRSGELNAYAKHLRRTRATLTQYEQELSEAYQQFQAEYDGAVRETQALKDRALEEADAIRRGAEDGHGSANSARLSDTAHGQPREIAGVAAEVINQLRQETEEARAELAEERNRVDKAESQVRLLKIDMTGLRQELRQREEVLEHLKAELEKREEKARPAPVDGEIVLAAPERLLALVEKLQMDVAERDDRIRDLQRNLENFQQLSGHMEKQAYETELNRYRVELEQERALLNEEIALFQSTRAEVDETRQELELQVSHERVQIAREWGEINRVREQLRREASNQEQAESAVRERPVKTRPATMTEVVLDVSPAPEESPAPQDLIARLRPNSKQEVGLTS